MLHDMGSTNTTLLNGQLVRNDTLLHVGDIVVTGSTLIRFEHRLDGDPWPAGARPFLDAVLAAPDDDLPRRVLADWLLERGDLRGEFIACQLDGSSAAGKRAHALLAAHELTWLAPLPVAIERWTFARGFLSHVRARDVAAAEALRRHHPLAEIEPLT